MFEIGFNMGLFFLSQTKKTKTKNKKEKIKMFCPFIALNKDKISRFKTIKAKKMTGK